MRVATITLHLRPTAISIVLGGIVLSLLGLHVVLRLAWPDAYLDPDSASAIFYRLIDIDGEANVPAWFSSGMWFFAAMLSWGISTRSPDHRWRWRGMFAVCLFLSLDEMAQLHEATGLLLKAALPSMRVYQRAWTFAGGALVLAAALFFARLLLSLKPVFTVGILAAGILFVTGAIGFELLGSSAARGNVSWYPAQIAWTTEIFEEGLEMFGVIIFIWTLLGVAGDEHPYEV